MLHLQLMAFKSKRGFALPFGASKTANGVNFSLYAPYATRINLHLFNDHGKPLDIISLDSGTHRTGDVWHVEYPILKDTFLYGWEVFNQKGISLVREKFDHLILDPFAKKIYSLKKWHHLNTPYQPLACFIRDDHFDWEKDAPPNIPLKDLILYEMHVRGFTAHSSSKVKYKGTYLGLIDKIPYLKNLGINAVELLPIFEFNENEYRIENPITKELLCNFWGYSTVQFFVPMVRYGVKESSNEFKTLVKAFHEVGIEVILDVVYNHTAELGSGSTPVYSFKALDPYVFYHINSQLEWENYSGCGNTINANHPIVIEWILTSLRHWVTEYHVDGFRFDLASILYRGANGAVLSNPPLIEAITEDPILSRVKLIAESWDAAGLYQVGSFFPQSGRWLEWNGKWRDSVRQFIKGTSFVKGDFATAISGSQTLFYNKSPLSSINFVTCHDGFTLRDLVSYNFKHNLSNGESNRDGSNENYSWNCGEEGPSISQELIELRKKQMKNFMVALFISQGIPMLLSGDEYGHTKEGNNNTWCHDSELNWFLWNELSKQEELFSFTQGMIEFRKSNPHFKKGVFLTESNITWYGPTSDKPQWNFDNHFVSFVLRDEEDEHSIYVAFNASNKKINVTIPKTDYVWQWCVNTNAETSNDIYGENLGPLLITSTFSLAPYSAIILKETNRTYKKED